jgi:TRAP-type C4-dicarboxylate transport system permease small subunit
MRFIQNIDNWLETIEKILVVVIFSALILAILVNVAARNLFQISLDKLFEIAPTLVVWLALLGASLAMKQGRHIKLEAVLRFCPKAMRRLAEAATSLFGLAVSVILALAAFEFLAGERAIFGAWGWVSIIFPAFFALTGFRFFSRLISSLKHPTNDPSPPSADASLQRRPRP